MSPHAKIPSNPSTLLAEAHELIAAALRAYRQPDAYTKLARFHPDQESLDWGTVWGATTDTSRIGAGRHPPTTPFPVLLRDLESMARKLHAVQVIMAGFASTAHTSEAERMEIFGMPTGKAAFRNVAEYLRDALRISLRDAKARTKLAAELLPSPSLDGGHLPGSHYPDLADRFFAADIDSTAAEIVIDTISQTQRAAIRAKALSPELDDHLSAGQQDLTEQATVLDPDGLRQIAKRWSQHTNHLFDQDGTADPEVLHRKRGAFYRGQVNGLHDWSLRVDSLFHERLRVLASVVNRPNTNFGPLRELLELLFGTTLPNFRVPTARPTTTPENGQQELFVEDDHGSPAEAADERTTEQKLLDGLTAVFDTGLSFASTTFPTTGGIAPQLSVIMDYQTLYRELTQDACTVTGSARPSATNFISQALFTGPISPSSIRPLSCEAELLPTVLGSQGVVLDVGRQARLFSPDQRRALIARDRGCTAPNCSIPAPWCDAHHVQSWRTGGNTSVANATLLCSHHHHAVHAGIWTITMKNGVAWFTPAPYLDGDRRPRRNRFWR